MMLPAFPHKNRHKQLLIAFLQLVMNGVCLHPTFLLYCESVHELRADDVDLDVLAHEEVTGVD